MLPLLFITLFCLRASSASSVLFPGPTACTAPSGVTGDCVLPADCPAAHGPPSRQPCGHRRGGLKFCCEPGPAENVISEPDLPTDCGLGGPQQSDGIAVPNISGGREAERSSWPWAALLGERSGSGPARWLCGGVLIGPRHVLTAAHCVAPRDSTLVVRLGEHDLRQAASSTRQERRVRRVLRHPEFRRSVADLALLVLESPVQLVRGAVHPVCLPAPDARLVGRSGYVVGWGELGFRADVPDVLQEALVTVVPTPPCERVYQGLRDYTSRFPGGFGSRVMCAEDLQRSGMDACTGDSGGPLSVRRSDGRYQLAGLVLEGMGCGGTDFPGLYTSVAHYVDWIRREVARS